MSLNNVLVNYIKQLTFNRRFILILLIIIDLTYCWLPDTSTKLINNLNKIQSIKFLGNNTYPDYFTVLHQDDNSLLLGGRNTVYNLSIYDLSERKTSSIKWPSSEAHGQLCILKGKNDEDCQNYIRILFNTGPEKFLICGTNSYKPLCRIYLREVCIFIIILYYVGKNIFSLLGFRPKIKIVHA